MNQVFQSAFAEDLAHMIDLKVSLGFSEQTYLTRAKQFDTFCFQHFPEVSELTEAIAFTWIKAGYEQMSKIIHTRVSFLRTFGKYLKSVGKTAYLISEQFTTGRTVFVPYIFDDEELTALFIAIDSFKSKDDTFCPILLSAYFRLTYTCGLRPAEGRLLKRNEVDLNSGELRIVNSKYHKSRNIVMSGDMRMLARKYAVLRDMKFPNSVYFFPSPTGDAYSARWIQGKFRQVPIMAETVQHFKNYVKVFHQNACLDSTNPLFYTKRSGKRAPACADTLRKRIQKYAEIARKTCSEVPERVHPHLFRHSRAMHLYQHGMDLSLISQLLGHSNTETTLIYAYADTEAKRYAIEQAMKNTPGFGGNAEKYTVTDKGLLQLLYAL